ncbi:hypothetical protein OsccyDRAFT_0482 [Leptolyngbyaceae cyanobacterium JSC-12]|nr:hypothetical protein OsccyDRAFT_0482 [Leptolyngbyaceae cyanobacterium JSC-12]
MTSKPAALNKSIARVEVDRKKVMASPRHPFQEWFDEI